MRRLQSRSGALFVTAPPDAYKRGDLLYVQDARPLHGETRLRIGLVKLTEPKSAKVAWYCRPNAPVDAALAGEGLPVEDLVPDTTVRVGKCWGRYTLPPTRSAGEGSTIDLALNLGEGDGLRPGDLFEVLGEAIVDTDSRTVLDVDALGRCTIAPFEGTPLTSVCRLDRTQWQGFDPNARRGGGFVRLLQEAPPRP